MRKKNGEIILELILIIILIGLLTLLFILGSFYYSNNLKFKPKNIPNSEEEIINNCRDLSLVDSAYCLKSNVKTFYNYSVTNESYNDVCTIQKIGGDCYNYAKLYENLGEKLNLNSVSYHIENGKTDHRITIISNEEGYCILDLMNVVCFKLE